MSSLSDVSRSNSLPSAAKKPAVEPSWVDKMSRNMVFSHLRRLQRGRIEVREGMNRWVFGEVVPSQGALSVTMTVHDSGCYREMVTGGSIGMAEAYMTGDWEVDDLTALVRLMAQNLSVLDEMESGLARLSSPVLKWLHARNSNTEKGSKRNIAAHYDLGNEFFKLFLDPTMMYSSGIFPYEHASMEEASNYKLRRICEVLELSETDRVIEIGTGWGGFAIYAAKNYGCKVTTTTISDAQYEEAQRRVLAAGLSDKITLLKEDYRSLEGNFDKLVSIEMIEAVGWQYYETFFAKCSELLKPGGRALIQAITIRDQRYDYARRNVDFIQKYIFPGSCIPSLQALLTANMRAGNLNLEHQQDFGLDYAKTLRCWHERFLTNQHAIRRLGYSEEFMRMWRFYLSYCEGGFAERTIGVSHLVFRRAG